MEVYTTVGGNWGEGAWGVVCVDLFHTLFIFNLKFKTLSTVKNPFLILQQKEWNPNLCTQEFHFDPFPRSTTSFLKTVIFPLKIFRVLLCLNTVYINDVISYYYLSYGVNELKSRTTPCGLYVRGIALLIYLDYPVLQLLKMNLL